MAGSAGVKVIVISNYSQSLINIRGPLLRAMIAKGHDVLACAPGEDDDVRRRLLAIGVDYTSIPLRRTGLNPLADLRTVVALTRLFRRHKPDRIFSYTIKPVVYGPLAAQLAGVPRENVFSMVTGLGFAFTSTSRRQRLLSAPIRALYRSALHHCNGVFFHNPDDRRLFVELGLLSPPTKGLLMNGSGVDLNEFAERPAVPEPVTFLLIARLLRGKGIEEYVEAASALKARYPRARFRIVGPRDTNPEGIPGDEIRAWEQNGAIEYGGGVSDVRPELAAASVFVLPSHREGRPRAVLEAMGVGRAIITTDAPGCRETVRDGRNGFLVPVGDAPALQHAMERFLLDPSLIGTMGRASRAIAVEEYDVNKVNAGLLREMELD